MATIAVVTDLIFGTKITGTAKALGKSVSVARTLDRLREHLAAAGESPLVIVDLNATGVDPIEAVKVAKASGGRVLAYLSHVQAELAVAAREAGADEVMARSGFVEALPGVLQASA